MSLSRRQCLDACRRLAHTARRLADDRQEKAGGGGKVGEGVKEAGKDGGAKIKESVISVRGECLAALKLLLQV
jgi:hypothetical protein